MVANWLILGSSFMDETLIGSDPADCACRRNGRVVMQGTGEELLVDPKVRDAYLGG